MSIHQFITLEASSSPGSTMVLAWHDIKRMYREVKMNYTTVVFRGSKGEERDVAVVQTPAEILVLIDQATASQEKEI